MLTGHQFGLIMDMVRIILCDSGDSEEALQKIDSIGKKTRRRRKERRTNRCLLQMTQ